MSKTTDKLIDDIIELILGDVDCQHEVDHDEDGVHTSVEYSLNDEAKLRGKIRTLLKPEVTEEWIEEKMKKGINKSFKDYETEMQAILFVDPINKSSYRKINKATDALVDHIWDSIHSLVEEIPAKKPTVDKEFVGKWEKVFPVLTQADVIFNKNNIKQMLKEAGVKVVRK